jgi:hypothetical protein
MSSQSRTKPVRGAAAITMALIVLAGAMLAGCSDIYFDRREAIALGADDHIATDRVAQMIDPWPAHIGNRNIAFNGEKMQSAVERYRTNRVIPPVGIASSSVGYLPPQEAAPGATNQPTMSAPAASVK